MAKNTPNTPGHTHTRPVNVTKGKKGFQETEKSEPDSPFDVLTPDRIADLMDLSVKVAEKWSRHRGAVDSEAVNDIASESLVQLLDAIKKRGGLMEKPEGYLTTIVKNESASVSATVSKSARAGFKALNERVDTIEQQMGRSLTSEELDVEAEAILAHWHDPKHKPPKDFWKKGPTRAIIGMSFSEPGSENGIRGSVFGDEDGQRIDDRIAFDDSIGSNRWSSSLLRITDEGRSNVGNIFRYNAHAETLGVPLAVPGWMTRRSTDNARNAINKATGVQRNRYENDDDFNKAVGERFHKVIESWERGDDTEATRALFMPFGETTTPSERQAIVGALMVRPAVAHDLWRSALGAANRSNYDRIMQHLGEV